MAIIEAVLWDMDGVLVDSERLVRDIFIEVMADAGLKQDLKDLYDQTIGLNAKSIIALYQQLLGSADKATYYFELIESTYRARMATELIMKPGVCAALDAIADEGLPQMVVTSTKTESAHRKINHFNLGHYFCDLVGGDQVTHGKPNPEPYLLACQKLGVEPSRVLIVEDSPNGVRAGINAGCMVMHVPDLIATDPHWQHEIYASIETLDEFPAWLIEQRGGDWV